MAARIRLDSVAMMRREERREVFRAGEAAYSCEGAIMLFVCRSIAAANFVVSAVVVALDPAVAVESSGASEFLIPAAFTLPT